MHLRCKLAGAYCNSGIARNTAFMTSLFSFVISIVPILFTYKSFVPGVNMGELVLVIFSFFTVFTNRQTGGLWSKRIMTVWYLYILFIAFNALISIALVNENSANIIVRTVRYSSYYLFVIICSRKIADVKQIMKWVLRISVIIVSVIIIQYILYYSMGMRLKFYIPSLIYTEGYNYITYSSNSLFRPASLFLEPSLIGQYLYIPLAFCLLSKTDINHRYIFAFISSAGMLLSKSLWTYIFLIVIWGIWLLSRYFAKDIKHKFRYLPLLIIVPAICIYLWNTTIVQDAVSRLMLDNITESAAFRSRFSGYDVLDIFSVSERIFGIGFGNLRGFSASNYILYVLIGTGYIGVALFFLFCFISFMSVRTRWQRTALLCFFLLCWGGNAMLSVNCVLQLSVCFAYFNDAKINE